MRPFSPITALAAAAVVACPAFAAAGQKAQLPATAVPTGVVALGATPAGQGDQGELRIMPLGDSITWGLVDTGGYRAPLYNKLESLVTGVDWVGSAPPYSFPGAMDDWHHEGHPGWKIRDVIAFAGDQSTPATSIEGLLEAFDPAVILLHIGTNDLNSLKADPIQALTDLWELLGRIYATTPDVQVMLAQLVPVNPLLDQTPTLTFNAGIPAVANSYAQAGYAIKVVDMYSAFRFSPDWAGLYVDGLHPNQDGYDLMADVWFDSLLTVAPPTNPPVVDLPLLQSNYESESVGAFPPLTDDLIAAGSPTLASVQHVGYSGHAGNPISSLNDGKADGHATYALDPVDGSWRSTFNLNLNKAPRGYDIEAIRGLNYASLTVGAQAFEIEVELVTSPGVFTSIGSFRYAYSALPFATQAGGSAMMLIEHEQGFLARGVRAIRFTFSPDPGFNAAPAYTEIDVVGTPAGPAQGKPLKPANHRPLKA
ncbi:SGNH/GDSL hydrolase family protein [Engelhardtia mirabilis]|uniref:GDSL-like Lipase/Acylhydrolase n=1 Tax=Engelhardtia mirabilis TaxID=2528011 RepID=A0A518BDV4_9BACT|nr:GDSL-like Lipase/Acylhydrolase [Planctomycetes bacterium Pla133]QDU99468.1 GDSL-like Lipase/Acylhydrolase [Planctomycetes bacterium Pla86]